MFSKKIKSIYYLLFFLMMPFLAMAQYATPATTGLPTGDLANGGIIINIMNWLLIILGVVGIIGFVLSGIFYLTAAGDEDRMKMGKNSMKWSIVGVIVGLMGFVIIQAINSMLNESTLF